MEQRSILQRAFLRKNGRPKKVVRRLLFHTSGRPRGIFKNHLISEDGTPCPFFKDWMTSAEYLVQRDFNKPPQSDAAVLAASGGTLSFSQLPKRALIIDSTFPNPNRDSGSIDAVNYVNWLLSFGFEVNFIALDHDTENYDDSAIRETRATTLRFAGHAQVVDYIHQNGNCYNLFFLSRVCAGGAFLEDCRISNPAAAVIFNTVDLHHIREMREAELADDQDSMLAAQKTRDRELHLVRQSDLTIVVSEFEENVLNETVPGANIAVMPLFRDMPETVPGFEQRQDIGFVGGFRHTPNVDAIEYFLYDIWPKVRAKAPKATFSIAGGDLPDSIADALPEGVSYIGHVEDLTGWLNRLKMTVAPLRYGAGAKGKVASSVAHGVPIVGTHISFEGMGLADGVVIAAENPAEFAEAIVDLLEDPTGWNDMSRNAIQFAQETQSPAAGQKRLEMVFRTLRLGRSDSLL